MNKIVLDNVNHTLNNFVNKTQVNNLSVEKVNLGSSIFVQNNVVNNNQVNNPVVEKVVLSSTNNTLNNVVNNSSINNLNNSSQNNIYKVNNKYVNNYNKAKGQLQGFTMTKKYYVAIQPDEKKHEARLILVDKKTEKMIYVPIDEDCGHANDMEYDSKRNRLVIMYKDSKTGKGAIRYIELNSGKYKTDVHYIEHFGVNSGKIAYDEKEDAYYITAAPKDKQGEIRKIDASTFLEDKNFGIDGKVTYKSPYNYGDNGKGDYLSQGITYHNNKIYYVANDRSKWKSYIMEYDLEGNMLNKATIPYSEGRGELEGIKFDENGKLYGLFITKNQGPNTGKNFRVAKIESSTPINNDALPRKNDTFNA